MKKRLSVCAAIACAFFAALGAAVFAVRFSPFHELSNFKSRPWSTRVYDRNGELLYIAALDEGMRREFTPLSDIPVLTREVFIAAEDRRFFRHHGIDAGALARAALQNLTSGRKASGGSTITMQLARLIVPAPKRSFINKIRECWNALRIEACMTKSQILELYLNTLPFGFQTEGITSAARNFFCAELSDLTLEQTCCLAVIPRRPSAYNPLREPELCAAAAADLLRFMSEDERSSSRFERSPPLSENEYYSAVYASALKAKRFSYPAHAPHFVRYALSSFNGTAPTPEARLTIDLNVQRYAHESLRSSLERNKDARIGNGAIIVIDNNTGEALAWIGSADFYDESSAGQIDGVTALNQPGSSMKPFLYAMALERGWRPQSILPDIPVDFGSGQVYIPMNFNKMYNGPVRLRAALASSLNVPAVYLLNRIGVNEYCGLLEKLGIKSIESSRDSAGLGLALGNAPVSLLELTRAFSVFARDGELIPLRYTIPEEYAALAGADLSEALAVNSGVRIFDSDASRLICSILSDRAARASGFGFSKSFETPFPAIFKTGTSNQFQNITALASTPLYTVGVWMGNFSGETIIGKTGSSVPAAIARDILIYLQGDIAVPFKTPTEYVWGKICPLSGMNPGQHCSASLGEYVLPSEGGECDWHRGGGQIVYPAEYQQWFSLRARNGEIDYAGAPLALVFPSDGAIFFEGGSGAFIPAEASGGAEETLFAYYDGELYAAAPRPFAFDIPLEKGAHVLTIKCGAETASARFTVK